MGIELAFLGKDVKLGKQILFLGYPRAIRQLRVRLMDREIADKVEVDTLRHRHSITL